MSEPVGPAEPAPDPPGARGGESRVDTRRAQRRDRRRQVLLLVVAALLAAFAFANLVIAVNRIDPAPAGVASTPSATADTRAGAYLTDPDSATAFLAAAGSDVAAVSSYDYRRLDDTLSAGLAVTTGAYRRALRAALTGTAAAALRRAHTVQEFQVLSTGIGTVDGAIAKVLLFGEQVITSTAGRRGDTVTLLATVLRQGDRYLIVDLAADTSAGLPPGTPDLAVAAEAGRAEVARVLTYRHDHFDGDYQRALDGAVDPLRSRLAANAAATRAAVVAGGYDLAGTVIAVAVERASGSAVVLMMATTTTRTPGGSTADGQYEVTVVNAQGTWVTSVIAAVTAE